MNVWLLQKPVDADRDTRALYLRRITSEDKTEVTPLPILARRFFTSDAAHAFAMRFGDRFADWRVVRRS